MKKIRIKNISDNYFNMAWELYEDAFPIEERRIKDDQICVLKKDNYHFDVLIDENQFIGFILWWDFETFRYIDHFATSVPQRNKGKGKMILKRFITTNDKAILLEVELPTSSINKRRIKFYERIGFKLNTHYYEIPATHENHSPLQLLLMSYPNKITTEEVELFINNCHSIIFNKQV